MTDMCPRMGQSLADTYSARPGSSEHQTGLALDINTASVQAHFENTPTYAWLVEHCAEYGFILRYPEGKERITGYRFEPWHYRYVGKDIAKLCMERDLTYEEYVARLPVQGTNGVPALYIQGRELELGSGALSWRAEFTSLPAVWPRRWGGGSEPHSAGRKSSCTAGSTGIR